MVAGLSEADGRASLLLLLLLIEPHIHAARSCCSTPAPAGYLHACATTSTSRGNSKVSLTVQCITATGNSTTSSAKEQSQPHAMLSRASFKLTQRLRNELRHRDDTTGDTRDTTTTSMHSTSPIMFAGSYSHHSICLSLTPTLRPVRGSLKSRSAEANRRER